MNPTQTSELKAFVFSLSQLDASLPNDVQTKINQVNIPVDVDKLHDIAISYSPLASTYKKVLKLLDDMAEYRSKGDIPQYNPDKRNSDIDNDLVKIEAELVDFGEIVNDNKKLTEIAVTMTIFWRNYI